MEHIPLTWIILAGGKSRRMGQEKHTLPWGNSTLLDTALEKARRARASEILISGSITYPPYRSCPDIYPDAGPLGGIHACLNMAQTEFCMVLPVDIPLFPEELAIEMAQYAQRNDLDYATLMWNGEPQPVVAVIRRSARTAIEGMLCQADRKVRHLSQFVKSGCYACTGEPDLLGNCNTPQQYAYLHHKYME